MTTITPGIRLNVPDYDSAGWDTLLAANWTIIDSLLSRAAGVTLYSGVYAANTTYSLNATVTDPADGSLWQTNTNYTTTVGNTFAQERAAFPGRWTNVTASAASASVSAAAASSSATAAAASATAAASSASTASTASASANNAAAGVSGFGGFKNAVVNGGMRIWQRGSPITVPPSVGTWTADRWKCAHDGTGGTTTVTKAGNLASSMQDLGLLYALNYNVSVVATTQTFRQLQTQINAVTTFAGRQVTISAWLSVASGTITVVPFLTQYFGTGGSPSANVNTSSGSWSVTTTPTKFTFTTTLPSFNGKTFGSNGDDALLLTLNLPLTGTYSLNVTGVQLELGAGATDFSYRPETVESVICQAFYQTGSFGVFGYAPSGTTIGGQAPMRVRMIKAPTIVTAGVSTINASSLTLSSDGASLLTTFITTVTGGGLYSGTFTATAEIL